MRLLLALLVLAAAAVPARAQTDGRIFPYDVTVRDLANGLRVVVVPTPFPDVVSLQIVMGTGSRDEVEPGKSGFAHFFEHMMFRGSETISAAEYQDLLKRAGGDQNAYTSDDRTVYHTTFLKDDLDTILRIEADRFQNLSYSEPDFRTEALAVLGEYNKNASNPVRQIFEAQREVAFQDHTYRHTTMGFLADIEAMPEGYDYAQSFFDRFYRPENAVVLLAGDLDPEQAIADVERHFGSWARGYRPPEIPTEAPLDGPVTNHVDWDAPTPPWMTVAFRGPAAYGPSVDPAHPADMQALDVLSALAFGPSSELYQRLVVEEQLADQLWASFPDSRDPGLLTIAARVPEAENLAAVRDAIQQTLAAWRVRPVDAAELDALKSRFRYGFAGGLDNTEAIADALVPALSVTRDPATLETVYARYAAITPDDVLGAANRTFRDANMVVVTLGHGELPAEARAPGSVDARVSTVEPVGSAGPEPAPTPGAAPAGEDAGASAGGTPAYRTLLRPSESPLVTLRLVFAAGAADDPEGQEGLAELTARMLADAGTASRTYAEIQEALFPLAAGYGVQVDKDMTVFAGSVHRDNLDAYLELFGDALLAPGFREDDFERVRRDLLSDLRTGLRQNNDEELGKEVLYEVVYGGHPYGSATLGHGAAIEALTLDDVRAFYARHYTQRALTLAVAGGDAAAVQRRLDARLRAALPLGAPVEALDRTPVPEVERTRVTLVAKPGRAAAISLGFPIPVTRAHPDFVALDVVRSWLGEHRNSSAHLFQRMREARGMNYGDYAYLEYFPDGMFRTQPAPNLARGSQLFQVWIRPVPTEQAHFALRIARYELDTLLRDGMLEADFEATRAFLGKYAALLTATQGRALGYAVDQEVYGLDGFVAWYRAELAALTLDDVNRALREHLAGPDGRLRPQEIVVVTPEAEALRDALVAERPSPIEYASPKPDEIYVEDRVIATYPLGLAADAVRIVDVEAVFEGPVDGAAE